MYFRGLPTYSNVQLCTMLSFVNNYINLGFCIFIANEMMCDYTGPIENMHKSYQGLLKTNSKN